MTTDATPAVAATPCESPSTVQGADRPLVWVDGAIIPRSQAKISVFDKCALYGDGVFEGIRAYNGRVFKMRSHLMRLARSAEAIRLTLPYSIEAFERIIRETLDANGLADAYIRLVVTRGPGSLGLDLRLSPTPSVFCIVDALQLFDETRCRRGLSAAIVDRPRIPVECLDPRVKACNYLNNILAHAEAKDAGADEAIMLTTEGFVAEAAGENVFVVKDGALTTPPTDAGILEGITRAFMLELCRREGLQCAERMLKPEELFAADEVFFTGTGAEVIGVSRIDGEAIGAGEEGPITRTLRTRFHEIVRSEPLED